jgi:hypothetical protein
MPHLKGINFEDELFWGYSPTTIVFSTDWFSYLERFLYSRKFLTWIVYLLLKELDFLLAIRGFTVESMLEKFLSSVLFFDCEPLLEAPVNEFWVIFITFTCFFAFFLFPELVIFLKVTPPFSSFD